MFRRWRRPARAELDGRPRAAGSATADDPRWTPGEEADGEVAAGDSADEWGGHFCVCCDRPLGFDPEDEIDGEGPCRDICGSCNRGRNQDVVDEAAWRDGR